MFRRISRRWGVSDIKMRFVDARTKSCAPIWGHRRDCHFLVHNETGRFSFPDGGFGRLEPGSVDQAGNLKLNFADILGRAENSHEFKPVRIFIAFNAGEIAHQARI